MNNKTYVLDSTKWATDACYELSSNISSNMVNGLDELKRDVDRIKNESVLYRRRAWQKSSKHRGKNWKRL